MKKNFIATLLGLLVSTVFLVGFTGHPKCPPQPIPPSVKVGSATITDRVNYYEVILDLEHGHQNHYQVGKDYATAMLKILPNIESLLDSYLENIVEYVCEPQNTDYSKLLMGTSEIAPQIPREYRNEIDGMASVFSGANVNVPGDGKLSRSELYLINLLGTLVDEGCSAISVFGGRSATGQTMTAHLVDYWQGLDNQLSQVHAVTFIKNGPKSIGLFGFLTYLSGMTGGFNLNGVYGASMTSDTKLKNPFTATHDSGFDFRYQLENQGTVSGIAGYMSNANYADGETWVMADPHEGKIFENNLQGKRALRSWDSRLNPGIDWGFPNAVASVNSFILLGNTDNHTITDPEKGDVSNLPRWANYRNQLAQKGEKVTWEELKEIVSYNGGSCEEPGTGDIYNIWTYQIVVFNSTTRKIEIAFRPKNATEKNPDQPVFQTIKLPPGFMN